MMLLSTHSLVSGGGGGVETVLLAGGPPAVASLQRDLSTIPAVTTWCVCGCR